MSLQLKVIILLIALVTPLTAGFTFYTLSTEQNRQRERSAERHMLRTLDRPMLRCDRTPERFAVHRNRFSLYAYNANFQSAHAQAIRFPEKLKKQLLQDPDNIAHTKNLDQAITAGKRVKGTTDCTYLLMVWRHKPMAKTKNLIRIVFSQSAFFLLALLGTGIIITVPLVRRIKRLTKQVEQAPEHDFSIKTEIDARDELGALARAFNDMGTQVNQTITQLHERDATLKEYISNTTHDLAIPLTVLQHRLRKMQKLSAQGELIEQEQLSQAMEESHYIASLIANMSAAAKLDAGREHIKRHAFDIGETVERVASRHMPLAQQKEIELNWATPPENITLLADSTLVEQAISNLVQNAMQYNDRGGHISIILDVDTKTQSFDIKVLDDGPGIPEELLSAITDRHHRGDDNEARTRNPKGQGFGLSIVKRVCQLHDFELEFENMPEAGLMVTISGQLIAD